MEEIKKHSLYFNKNGFGLFVTWDFSWKRLAIWIGPISYEYNWRYCESEEV